MRQYELLRHTADLGIKVWGKDLKSLFSNAASAMYDLISDTSKVKPFEEIEVEIRAQDRDALLRDWLAELLSFFHTKGFLLSKFNVKNLSDTSITSCVSGEQADQKRHALKHDIKAVTFHSLKIREEKNRFSTEIIFDV